jgi:AcrR family transcriptional regulator
LFDDAGTGPAQSNSTTGANRGESENHRSRVGRERRERMRKHLLQSVTSVCSGRSVQGRAVIDDVIKHAGVSRGTFYKYFESLEQAIAEVAYTLVEEMVDAIPYYHALEDPVMRTATGFQTYLARAIIDHEWGGFVTHLDLLGGENVRILEAIQGDMRKGVANGDYVLKSIDTAADLLMGAKIEAMRRIVAEGLGAQYMREMTELVLTALGVPPARAEEVVREAFDKLCELGPGNLVWWRPIE